MIVLYWMTPDPIVVTESTSLYEVLELTRKHGVRRLPVVRNEDELCGIIGRTDLYRTIPKRLIDDSIPAELEETLRRRTVGELMRPDPVTCDVRSHIEDVCRKFCETKVGAMPVLNRGHLVGIISEVDLIRALAELTHSTTGGRRITLLLPKGTEDVLYPIIDLCRRHHLELKAILTHSILEKSELMATIRVEGRYVDRFVRALWDEGYKVVDETRGPEQPG